MTELEDIFKRQIAAAGPMAFAHFMRDSLLHPQYGYYQHEAVFGAGGDFITAPEVSQMFGEILGLWCADRWIAMGRPKQFILAEFGPGRGTLMSDMLRAAAKVPGFQNAAKIYFVEGGERRKSEQEGKVPNANWITGTSELPALPTLMVMNEFFDALPVHQYIYQEGKWRELAVGINGDNKLAFALTNPGASLALKSEKLPTPQEGDKLEICPLARQFMVDMARHIAQYGGAGLALDYGYAQTAYGDTLQAVSNHEYTGLLDRPGKVDLTAHVDFQSLLASAEQSNTHTFGAQDQGMFLMSLGLGQRAQQLARGKSTEEQENILTALKRLTAPSEMGTLFKVIAWQHADLAPPPGF